MFIHRYFKFLVFLAFFATVSCDSPTTETKAAKATHLADTHNLNPAFWDYAVSSNMLQVKLGKLASEKGTTQQIKDLGKKSESFHSEALGQLKKLGGGHQAIILPDSLGSADRMMVMEFSALQGAEFDTRYRDHILISHKVQAERYADALEKADSPGLKKWLEKMQKQMREQLQEVEQADSSQVIVNSI